MNGLERGQKKMRNRMPGFVVPPLADGLFFLVMASAAVLFMPSIFDSRRECGFCKVESPAFGGALFCDATFRA
jgi:hypothetical protein